MLGYRFLVTTKSFERPCTCGLSVGHGLERGECFGRDDEQRLGGIEILNSLGEVGAIDVRNEAEGEIALGVMLERLIGHDGTEVGAADADVHDIADALSCVTLPVAAANTIREGSHAVEYGMHIGDDILSIHQDRASLWGA